MRTRVPKEERSFASSTHFLANKTQAAQKKTDKKRINEILNYRNMMRRHDSEEKNDYVT